MSEFFTTENIAFALQVLMIIVSLFIVFHEKNFTIIILISVFSLIAATLYTMNQAPDVAIAEVAIGAAIIPLIYVISISRQREFIVLDKSRHGFIDPNEELEGVVYEVLTRFVDIYDLKLNVCCDIEGSEEDLTNQLNVDLIISYDPIKDHYTLKGKASSTLMSKLSRMTSGHPNISVVVFKGGDSID
jgi:uncharacterized MnhB-related membrane protein